MADNFLERHQEEYEIKKKTWEAKSRIRKIKELRTKMNNNQGNSSGEQVNK